MKNMILLIFLWATSISQLFGQEPLASIQAHTALCNDLIKPIADTTGYEVGYADVLVQQKLDIISMTEEDQLDTSIPDAFFMYPNPTSGVVQVKLSGKVSVYIYNLSGQLIKRYNMSPGEMKLDLTALPAGMYQVRAKSDDEYYSGKLLLQ